MKKTSHSRPSACANILYIPTKTYSAHDDNNKNCGATKKTTTHQSYNAKNALIEHID